MELSSFISMAILGFFYLLGDHWPLIGIAFFWFIHLFSCSVLNIVSIAPPATGVVSGFCLLNMNFSYAMFGSIFPLPLFLLCPFEWLWMSHIDSFHHKDKHRSVDFRFNRAKNKEKTKTKNLITHNNSFMHHMLCIWDLCFL